MNLLFLRSNMILIVFACMLTIFSCNDDSLLEPEAEYTNATSEIQTRNLPGDGGPVDPELEGYFFHLKMSCAKEYSEDGWIEFDEYFSNKQDCVCALNNYSQYVCSGDGAFSVQVDEKCTSKYTTVPSLSSCTP